MKEAKQAKGRYLRVRTYNKSFKSKTLFMYEYVGQFLGDFKIRICHFVLVLNTLKQDRSLGDFRTISQVYMKP